MEFLILMVGIVLVALGAAVYFLPAVIAALRDHKFAASIFVVNLFFGWTLIGWVGCLAWALSPQS